MKPVANTATTRRRIITLLFLFACPVPTRSPNNGAMCNNGNDLKECLDKSHSWKVAMCGYKCELTESKNHP